MTVNPEQIKAEVAQMFGNKPEDVYPAKKAEAFEDMTADNAVPSIAEPAMNEPTGDVATVEDLLNAMPDEMPEEEASLVDKLQALIDNEATDKEVKATAEELLARLEELSAVEQNINDFLAENAPAEVQTPAEGEVSTEGAL